jgi:8-oxo-dGTP pyrophosphatase MutT (NUDIX family)
MSYLIRHIRACNNTALPGERLPFRLGPHQVGWVAPALVDRLASLGARRSAGSLTLDDPAALPMWARFLAEAGMYQWRDEAFDVRATPEGPVLSQVDRGALPILGIEAVGVHLNGLVRRPDGLHVWLARRAMTKLLDPGKLDHIVAGGVPAGLNPVQTLEKEAAEEAALSAALVASATHQGVIRYIMDRPEGLRRDTLHCYDLVLPASFIPHPVDGEVAAFELWPIADVLDTVRETDNFKFNVNLVLIDLFLRHGLVAEPEASLLRAALVSPQAASPRSGFPAPQ